MNKSSTSSDLQESAGFVGGLVKQARLAWRLWTDGRVPGWVKLIPIAGFLYLLSPIDLIPDFLLPGLGEVDDIVILLIALKTFLDLSPPGVVREHLKDLFGVQDALDLNDAARNGGPSEDTYIEASYQILDSKEK